MKRLKNECKNQMRRHRKGTSRFLALFLALAMIVSLGVDLSTTSLVHATERQGEPAYTCGKTEHVHSIKNGCYALTCGLDETDGEGGHEHTLSCYDGVEPTCGNEDEDHEHTLDCYDGVDPICGLETGEGAVEEHHHTDACYDTSEYICGKDYHEHDDSCEESNTIEETGAAGTTETTDTTDDTDVTEDDDVIRGRTYSTDEGEEIAVVTSGRRSARRAMSRSGNSALTGIDMGNYLGSVKYEKKDGSVWKESSEFTTDDQVRATLSFDNVTPTLLQANRNTLYVQLPDIIDCSKFTDTYETYDGDTKSGTYTYQQVDGHWYIVLVLEDDYVKNAGNFIGGELEFRFTWDKEEVPDEGTTKDVIIGNQTAQIKIEKGQGGDDGSGTKYNLYKQAGSLTWSEDSKTAYITYTVNLTVKNDVKAPITLSDVLSGSGFAYDTEAPTITAANGGSYQVNYSNTKGDRTSTDFQIWPSPSGDVVKEGNYTITYRVKTTVADASDWNIEDQTVSNSISVPDDGGNKITSQTWTRVTTGTIDKQGRLVDGTDGTYIDYTVYLNSGTIVKNIKEPAVFKDTLQSDIELVGDVTVKQYKPDGTLNETYKATVDGQNISYTTPTGQYYYIITYRTKVKDTVTVPAEGLTVKNTGTSTGGVDGSSSSEVTVPSHALGKEFVSQDLAQDGDKWVDTIQWRSTINASDSFNGYVYEDWGGLMQKADLYWFAPLALKEGSVVLKDADGNEIPSSKYTLEDSDHTGLATQYGDASGSLVKNGLFKITFTSDDIKGPVTIEYTTTVDMSPFTVGQYLVFYNYASLTKDGKSQEAQAQTKTLEYATDAKKIIHKRGAGWSTGSSEDVLLDPGQDYIEWTIGINEGMTMQSDLTVTDELKDGLTLDESTLKVMVGQVDFLHLTSGQEHLQGLVTYTYQDNKLVVNIKKGAYTTAGQSQSQTINITFHTKLPADFIGGGDATKTFSNTATVSQDGGSETPSTYEEKVTRQVVGKSGSYDKETQTLTYQIILNPDAATLGNGNTLKVTDTLDAGGLQEYIQLESIELFTAVKTTNSQNKVEVKPGKLVRTLTDVKKTSAESLTAGDKEHYLWVPYQDKTDEIAANTFMTYIEDSTAYVAVVKYTVTTDVAADTTMNNHVEIEGNSKWNKTDSSTKAEQNTSGSTYTGHRLKIIKHDMADYDTLLGGATFRVDAYKNGQWTENVTTLTTADKTGAASTASNTIEAGVIYRVVETTAPSEYIIDETPSYFVVLVGDAAMPNLPDGVQESDVTAYHVASGKYANVIIDRYDEKGGTLVVTKVDQDATSTTLSGATFQLLQYNKSSKTWTSVTSFTTGDDGKAAWIGIAKNVLYKMVETTAPGGYKIDPEPSYFIVVNTGDESYQADLPASDKYNDLSGVEHEVVISQKVQVTQNDATAEHVEISITRKDEKDIEPGQIRVTKAWVDAWGNPITSADKLNNMPEVEVTLTKHVAKATPVVTVAAGGSSGTISVNPGGYIVFKGVYAYRGTGDSLSWSCDDNAVKIQSYEDAGDQTYTYTVGPITKNCTITSQGFYWDSLYSGKATAQGGTPVSGTDDTDIGTVELNSGNNWTHLWKVNELDQTAGVTYTITEKAIDGYQVTYKVNGEDLAAGATFQIGTKGELITVTNTADRQYDLPKTGGSGTLPYTMGGMAAIVSSMFAGCSMWRRRRDERRCD